MKKILMFLLVGMFCLSFVSAANIDNFKYERDKTFNGKDIQGDKLLEKYKPIEIRNRFGLGSVLFEGYLSQHTDVCSTDCKSTIEVRVEDKGVLIDDIMFIGDQPKSYNIKVDGKKYNLGEEVIGGTYTVEISGKKGVSDITDWVIYTNGEWLDSWATWGNISLGDDAEVILNSPADNYVSPTKAVTLNSSINITNGALPTNISLWTNHSGVWGINETRTSGYFTTLPATVNDSRYTSFDEFDDSSLNVSKWDLTVTGSGSATEGAEDLILLSTGDLSDSYMYLNATGLLNTGDIITMYFNKIAYSYQFTGAGTPSGKLYVNLGSDAIYTFSHSGESASSTSDVIVQAFNNGTYWGRTKVGVGAYSAWTEVTGGNVSIYVNAHGDGNHRVWMTTNMSYVRSTFEWEQVFEKTISSGILWNVEACDSDGDCGFATANRTLTIDTTLPTITTEAPPGLSNYNYIGGNETLNVTFTDTNLDDCWYDYNGTNTTIDGCISGTSNQTNFILEYNNYNMTIWANDTVGNYNSTFIDWDYQILENSRTHNTTTYETAAETFSVNVTANSSLTSVKLIYNGTGYAASQSGAVWSYAMDIPSASIGNNSITWNFTYGVDTINSNYSTNQNVTQINLTYCTSGTPHINFTFKDEGDDSVINATIPTSNFTYYLGSGSVTKTLSYINNSENYYYPFCFTPIERNVTLDYRMQYQSVDYPQRTSEPDNFVITNVTTNKILYLLGTADGIYVTFQVINQADQLLSGVDVNATRSIAGSDVVVGVGTTAASGSVTFYLNPDFIHDFSFSKTGYTTYEYSEAPTQNSYTITLSGTTASTNSSLTGIKRSIRPSEDYLLNDTIYTFAFNLTSSYWDVSSYGFNLRLVNGTTFSGGNTAVEGTELTLAHNSSNNSIIYMDYWWIINGEQTNTTISWLVFNTDNTDWSLAIFFTDLETYLDSGIFGLDEFGRVLIAFLVLFISVGIMSYKYGFTSPMSITTLIFGIVFTLDVVTGFMPDIGGMSNLPTFLAGLILVLTIFNEVRIR